MIDLAKQIVDELQEVFSQREDEFNKTVVKEAYKYIPKSTYPRVVVNQINNSEVQERSTSEGERTTQLGLQIESYCRDMQEYDNVDGSKEIMNIANDYIMSNYKMNRRGDRVVQPYLVDDTVMQCIQRYDCIYDYETNLIYKN